CPRPRSPWVGTPCSATTRRPETPTTDWCATSSRCTGWRPRWRHGNRYGHGRPPSSPSCSSPTGTPVPTGSSPARTTASGRTRWSASPRRARWSTRGRYGAHIGGGRPVAPASGGATPRARRHDAQRRRSHGVRDGAVVGVAQARPPGRGGHLLGPAATLLVVPGERGGQLDGGGQLVGE